MGVLPHVDMARNQAARPDFELNDTPVGSIPRCRYKVGPRGIHVAHVVIDGTVDTPANADHEFEQGPQRLIQPHATPAPSRENVP